MARLKQPKRTEFVTEEELEAYDHVADRASGQLGSQVDDPEFEAPNAGEYFGALLNSPRLASIAVRMGVYVRGVGDGDGSYSHADREFVDQVLSVDWKTNVVQGVHVPDAVAVGVRIEAIDALRGGREEELNDDEQLLARFIRGTVSGTTDQQTFDAMLARMGKRGLVDYAAFALWLQWIIRMMQLLQTDDPDDAEIDRIVAAIKDGSYDTGDWRRRMAT